MKAIILLSGGLDSTLAAELMSRENLELLAVNFKTPFCLCDRHSSNLGCGSNAKRVADTLGIDLEIINATSDFLEVLKRPAHGYGANINPCIDCRILFFRKSRELMEKIGASFIITGEVLGQRPMSQRRDTFHVIERDADMRGMVLRPLSAKLLPPTQGELNGTIDREKLLSISGRSRNVQFRLAERYGISGFSPPAGGCLLTDKNFSAKLRDLFEDNIAVNPDDIRLLTVGRHYRFDARVKIVLGRNNNENNLLMSIAPHGYHLFMPQGFPGPVALLNGIPTQDVKQTIGRLIITYSKHVSGRTYLIRHGNEVFDPGDPLPIDVQGLRRIGADN